MDVAQSSYVKKKVVMKKKIALVIAFDGYQAQEFGITKSILDAVGHVVTLVSDRVGKATAHDGSQVLVSNKLSDIIVTDYDALVFIGGPGALEHLDHDLSYRIIQDAVAQHMVVAAICIAPRILAKAGVLAGKEATGWDEDNELTELYRHHGVIYVKQPVVTNGCFVTATGPAAAAEFGQALVNIL